MESGNKGKHQKNLYCPICGEFNSGRDVFKCPECGLDLICPTHRDSWLMVCSECSSLIRTEPFERLLLKLEQETPPKMVLISPGKFIIGRDDGDPNCAPSKTVLLQAFYIDEYPVTNEEYKKLLPDHQFKPGFEREPVREVTWLEARKYAELAGKRLPFEAEWEKAVRGVDGAIYPWGKVIPNYAGMSAEEFALKISSMSESPFGVFDGVGNVQEWVEDWYDPYPGNQYNDPAYGKSHKVLRGGNLTSFQPVSCATRRFALPDDKIPDAGFRCAKDTSVNLEFDITEERAIEDSRIQNVVAQIELEKKAREKEKKRDRIILHDKRIDELQEMLARLENRKQELLEKQNEPTIARKITYIFSGLWESLVKVSGSRREMVLRWVQVFAALLLIFFFFANVLIKEQAIFTIVREGQEFIAVSGVTGNNIKVLENLGPASDPEFSSDGKHIAFVREIDGQKDVLVTNVAGEREINVSGHPSNDSQPQFLPGGRIIWLSDRDGASNLYSSMLDGSDEKMIRIPSGQISSYDISPNGKTIALSLKVSGRWYLYTMGIDGVDVKQISQNTQWSDRDPVFTVNGKKLLFSSDREGNYELFYSDLDGTNPYRVTYSVGDEIGNHRFSRNGRWIYTDYSDGTSDAFNKSINRLRWDGRFHSVFNVCQSGCSMGDTGLKGFKRFFNRIFIPRYKPKFFKWKNDILGEGRIIDLGAKTRWFRTGVNLGEGDYLQIVSGGTWRSSRTADSPWTTPDGLPNVLSPTATLPGVQVGMLIAIIGDSAPFQIGTSQSFINEFEGELRLMMNDAGNLSDNEGMIEIKITVKSNFDRQVNDLPSFKHMKYFGFDDGINDGSPPDKYLGNTRVNLLCLSQAKLADPPSVIRELLKNGRSVLLEPSSLYSLSPQQLDKALSSFRESFLTPDLKTEETVGESVPVVKTIPPFAFYVPHEIETVSNSTASELIAALRRHFPGKPIATEVTSEEMLNPDIDISQFSKYDCLIVDLPQSINAKGQLTDLSYLPSHMYYPIEHIRESMPEMPLIIGIPLEGDSSRMALSKEQVAKIVDFYDSINQVVGVIIKGDEIEDDVKSQLGLLSASVSERNFPVDVARRNLTKTNPLMISNVVIGGEKPYNALFKGLAHDKDGSFLTCDRLNGIVLRIAGDGSIIETSHSELPDGTILDDVTGMYFDRNERVILLDGHPGSMIFLDDSLEYSNMIKLPGEVPGGIAGITAVVRDNSDNLYTISDDGDLLQKFDKNFNLISWVGGTSLYPGYFLSVSDASIGPRGSIYVVDRSKPYIQKFRPDLTLETILPLPGKDTFFNPVALFVTVDQAGSIYVVEKRTRNVYRYSPKGELVSYFELPAIPMGNIEVTKDGVFHTIMNGKLVSYDLNKETPPPGENATQK